MSARRWWVPLALALALSGRADDARAESPADVTNPRAERSGWVSDMAGILSGPAVAELDRIAGDLERTHGAEIAIVTVHGSGDLTPKEFATQLFNLWGIGKRGRDDGVLLLVVVDARRVEVETGYGAESVLPDARVGRILDRFVIPRFRDGDWDGGIRAGTLELARVLAAGVPEAPPRPRSRAPLATGLGLGAVAGLGLGAVARHRARVRHCPRCRRRMRRLDERQDDAYLDPAEQVEERLASMDHRVWRCDDCQVRLVEHHRRWFSGFADCPKCGRRTFQTTKRVVTEATTLAAGRMAVTRRCRLGSCQHHTQEFQVIPRVVESSGSSGGGGGGGGSGGGSFGGGSSGGGGAGRGW